MKKLLLFVAILISYNAMAQNKKIFVDSRVSGSPLVFSLYKKQADSSFALLKQGNSNYQYTFDSLSAGLYKIHVYIGYTKYIPTWHPMKVMWEDAATIDLTTVDSFACTDGLLPNPALVGPASLDGLLSEGLLKAPGDPLKNVRVAIYNNANTFIKMVSTNDSGKFYFTGVPLGTYKIKTDIVNTTNPNPKTVVLDSAHMSVSVALTVSKNGTVTTGVKKVSAPLENLVIYPNPLKDQLLVNSEKEVTVQFFDLTGKTVLNTKVSKFSPADVSTLNNGVYFIQIFDERGKMLITRKVIKLAE